MTNSPEHDLEQVARGWKLANFYSLERLQRVYSLEGDNLNQAVREGRLVLETVCLFIHACIRPSQYRLPAEFWRVLHAEYGIVVYPSAMTEEVVPQGLGFDKTFTEAYCGHIIMFGRSPESSSPPPCPMEFLQEPPPRYEK